MKAIALVLIWNHITKQQVEVSQEFEMDSTSIQSLIDIGAARYVAQPAAVQE